MADSSNLPYMPPIGAVCTARRLEGQWRIINHVFDGLVTKCVLESMGPTKQVATRFIFEITELSNCTYAELNDFMVSVSGLSQEDFDALDDSFDLENIDDNTLLQQIAPAVDENKPCQPESSGQNPPSKRFKSISDEDIGHLMAQNSEKSTEKQTRWAVKLLKDWMNDAQYVSSEFELLNVKELDALLKHFYASVRTKEGKEYSKTALVGLRAGINRHLNYPPFSRNINLMNDRDFMSSNQVLTGLIKSLKKEGKDVSQHKEPICEEDLLKLFKSGVFSDKSAKTLQNKVMYDIISQFGRRGQEGLRNLRKDSFKTCVDAKGRRYICMAYNETDKNHHGLDTREITKQARMYENEGPFCPVKSFEKYISKLNPGLSDFFQRPLKSVHENMEIWYCNKAVGINMLSSFMIRMSDEAKLSKRYTNHCIRAHVTSTLHSKGFSSRAIMSVTGHRNVASLASYIKPSEDERASLSRALCPVTSTEENSHKSAPQILSATALPSNMSNKHEASSSVTPPTVSHTRSPNLSLSKESNLDINLHESRAMHMFTGAISNSTITLNLYNAK